MGFTLDDFLRFWGFIFLVIYMAFPPIVVIGPILFIAWAYYTGAFMRAVDNTMRAVMEIRDMMRH